MLELRWRVRVEHGYGEPLSACALRWLLLDAPVLPPHSLRLRELDDGVALYAEPEVPGDGVLSLAMWVGDPLFDNYTEGLPAVGPEVPLFVPDGDTLTPQGHAPRLHAAQRLSLLLPLSAGEWQLRLQPRATVWKYLLLGDWGEPPPRVVDAQHQVRFNEPEAEALADGRRAWAIRSGVAIPLQRRAGQRFQLRAEGQGGEERVLIRQLPAANARNFAREVEGGATALVSEIPVLR
jgi:hypothetical protein